MKSPSVILQHKGEVLSQALEGTRYTGYQVFIYDDKNILVAEKEQ